MTEELFTFTVERSSQRLYLLALSFTHNHHDSEDICQNVFLKLWKCPSSFESDEHIDKWLTIVTINEAKNFLRRASRIAPLEKEELLKQYSFESDEHLDLVSAVMSLSGKESSVIQMYYYEEMSVREIAEHLKIKESAVKARLARGRAHLKEMIGEDYYEE